MKPCTNCYIRSSQNDDPRRGFKDLRLASWNVRSLYRPGAIYQVHRELQRYRIGIAALQEVRWPGNGECNIDGKATLFYSGDSNGKHVNGVGFLIDNKVLGNVIKFVAVSDRICVIRIKSRFSHITIVNVYAPTEITDDSQKDLFYEDLELVYDQIADYDVKIVVGDLNAQVGREDTFIPTIGKYSKHQHTNDNGLRLISFAASKSMLVKSTMFDHKDIHKGTWKSPDGTTVNQIDHVLVDSRHGSNLEDVRTYRGADCDSDHFLLLIKIKAKIRIQRSGGSEGIVNLDTEKLKDIDIRKSFQLELKNRFQELDNIEDINKM
ncbi:craniofacial development protein 2-like [Colias croceus]|uniref:craniofacial development protein 2-like n=1 Tax=Colias crocea TaxID=72248 RepID=UPI001E27B42D|nr:craniofacial development protein 2-like [Colias croceus]